MGFLCDESRRQWAALKDDAERWPLPLSWVIALFVALVIAGFLAGAMGPA